jgi:glycosyltransferase involved in cell wall biosynthesis
MRILLDLQGVQTESRHRGIGRYLREFTKAFLPLCEQHDVCILLCDCSPDSALDIRKVLHHLSGSVSFRVISLLADTSIAGLSDAECRSVNRRLLRSVVQDCSPDVLLIGSLFEDQFNHAVTVIDPRWAIPTAVIAYDLIPYLFPTTYLCHDSTKRWYLQKINELKQADLYLAISDSTKKEYEVNLSIEPERVVSISTGASSGFSDESLSRAELTRLVDHFRLKRPFIYSSGMVEPRKNLDGLIRAYALLQSSLRESYQLCISTSAQPHAVASLHKLARSLGIARNQLIIAGHLSDGDLRLLYKACTVFVFPSWHEGFGLPVLEAMQCGAAVLTSNLSSLPEVMGRSDALFDPMEPSSIARLISRVLTDEAFRLDLQAHAKSQASRFSWHSTAATALAALEQLVASSTRRVLPSSQRPRLAYVAPVDTSYLPRRDHHLQVLKHLDGYYDVAVYTPNSLSDFEHSLSQFDRVLIALDDHPDYSACLQLLQSCLAVVEMLDGHLTQLLNSSGIDYWLQVLQRYQGYSALLSLSSASMSNSCGAFAVRDYLDEISLGVIDSRESRLDLRAGLEAHYAAAAPVLALLKDPSLQDLASRSAYAAGSIAQAIAISLPKDGHRRQLLVDISILVRHDGGTGIQRVCKGILDSLLRKPPQGLMVEPVYLNVEGQFRYARSFTCSFLGLGHGWSSDDVVDVAPNDIYLGLDLNPELASWGGKALSEWAAIGVWVHFIVYDLLPISLPQCSYTSVRHLFPDWLQYIAGFHGLFCISKAVADTLERWLSEQSILENPLRSVRWFHLGSELDRSSASSGLPADAHDVLSVLHSQPTFLYVSTLEPRKAHAQLLDAVSLLWDQGEDFNLVLVGRQGWNVETLVASIPSHPLFGERLFWLDGISDEYLELVYSASSCLVNPSLGEGFGLPIVEAARRGLPLLLRDLPVFREVAADEARYFSGDSASDLALVLVEWLRDHERCPIPPPSAIPLLTWQQSTQILTTIILEESPRN